MPKRRALFVFLVATLVGCGSPSATDGGPRELDDAGVSPGVDGGPRADAGSRPDGGSVGTDAGPAPGPSRWAPQPWEDCEDGGRTLDAGPDDYRTVLDGIAPGDTLRLAPGTYTRGLPLRTSGEEGRCIVIEGADPRNRPLFQGSNAFNIVAVHGASWLKVRGLDIDGMGLAGFGVASQGGTDQPTHHVVIEDLDMVGLGANQQITGVSTKSPASDWVIRGNRIVGAGTGLYLGNSDGTQPFVRGVVEFNTVIDPVGYCMQIKHQVPRPTGAGLPTGPSQTVVRYNVFAKTSGASAGGSPRPNLLLGHFPTSGDGQDDRYLVYGNFFYDNATENLMQAEGNLAIWSNVFVNPNGGALAIQPHNDVPRLVDVFLNTVVASGTGIRISGGDSSFTQRVAHNAVFAGTPISADDTVGNTTGSMAEADSSLAAPISPPGSGLAVYPRPGALGASLDLGTLPDLPGARGDYEGRARTGAYVGAYAGPGATLSLDARSYSD